MAYLLTWMPKSVFSRIMFRSMSPLDICNMSKDWTIRSDTVPFPEPGAPMIRACSNLFVDDIFFFLLAIFHSNDFFCYVVVFPAIVSTKLTFGTHNFYPIATFLLPGNLINYNTYITLAYLTF